MSKQTLLKILMREEGFREDPYYCTEGLPTYGWGFVIGKKGDPLPKIKITREEADKKLLSLIETVYSSLEINADTSKAFSNCNDDRKAIMGSMVFQLGMYGLLKFKGFLKCANAKNWSGAADEMKNSLAYRQTKNRWQRQSDVMRTGSIEGIY